MGTTCAESHVNHAQVALGNQGFRKNTKGPNSLTDSFVQPVFIKLLQEVTTRG